MDLVRSVPQHAVADPTDRGAHMDLGIRGKVAFVTGGSKGMGRHAAQLLAAEGCKVIIAARTKSDIDDAVQ